MKFKVVLGSSFFAYYNKIFKTIQTLYDEHARDNITGSKQPKIYLYYNHQSRIIKIYYLFDAIPATVTITRQLLKECIFKHSKNVQGQNQIIIRIEDYKQFIKVMARDFSIKQMQIDLEKEEEQRLLRIAIGNMTSSFKIGKPIKFTSIQAEDLIEHKWFRGTGQSSIKFNLTKKMYEVMEVMVEIVRKSISRIQDPTVGDKDRDTIFLKLIANPSLSLKYQIISAFLKRKYRNKSRKLRAKVVSGYKRFIKQFNEVQRSTPPFSIKIQHFEVNQRQIYPKNIDFSQLHGYLNYRNVFKMSLDNARVIVKAGQLFGAKCTFAINTQGQINIIQQITSENDSNGKQKILQIGLSSIIRPYTQSQQQISEQKGKQTVFLDHFKYQRLFDSYTKVFRDSDQDSNNQNCQKLLYRENDQSDKGEDQQQTY